jgi:hypothetical protein
MIAAEREDAEAAQQVEIAIARSVEQILAFAGCKAHVEADGLEDPDHLLVQMLPVQGVSLRLPRCEQRCDIVVHSFLPTRPTACLRRSN